MPAAERCCGEAVALIFSAKSRMSACATRAEGNGKLSGAPRRTGVQDKAAIALSVPLRDAWSAPVLPSAP